MVKAIIFDCFGVLVTDALEALCGTLAPDVREQVKSLIRCSNKGLIDPEAASLQVAEILGISYQEYRQRIREGESRNQPLLDYILRLRQTYKTALLSNIGKGSLRRRFSTEELTEYFDAVIASGDAGVAKPEAAAYEMAAERLGVRLDECVFIDDRPDFCTAARAVGMQSILYRSFGQLRTELEELLD